MWVVFAMCVVFVGLTEAPLWIDGVLPPGDVISLESRPTKTLLMVNWMKVVVELKSHQNVAFIAFYKASVSLSMKKI